MALWDKDTSSEPNITNILGRVSISDKTSCRKITWSREIGSLNDRIALKFDKHIGSCAVDMPVKFQSDRIFNTNNKP